MKDKEGMSWVTLGQGKNKPRQRQRYKQGKEGNVWQQNKNAH